MTMTISVLEREMFSEAEAARLLELPQSTLHYWLEGGAWWAHVQADRAD